MWSAYLSQDTDETFLVHEHIREKFKTQDLTEDQLREWWQKEGFHEYCEHLKTPGAEQQHWGSEIEIESLAKLFKINAVVNERTLGAGNGAISFLDKNKEDRLIAFNIISKTSQRYDFKKFGTKNDFEKHLNNFCQFLKKV